MAVPKGYFEDYIRQFPETFRDELEGKLAYKSTLEADGRLVVPPRVWLAFLTPADEKAMACVPKKSENSLDIKKMMLDSFERPGQFLKARSSTRASSDCITLSVLEMLYDLETKRVLLSRERYEEWIKVAELFGLWKLRYALEDAVFKTFDPENFFLFESVVDKKMFMDQHIVLAIRDIVKGALRGAGLSKFAVKNRRKNIYGVYQKVAVKDININEVYDIHGFRIFTDSIPDCYKVIEVLHRLWPHLDNRYKDYIKDPKENGYQSLHTVVSCLERKPIEFQVRTYDMDKIAASGVANHADYKLAAKRKFNGLS